MKASYFLNGLKKRIKEATTNVDLGTSFDALVSATVRVEMSFWGLVKRKAERTDLI